MRFWLCILLGLQLVSPGVLAEEAETIAVIVPKSVNLRTPVRQS